MADGTKAPKGALIAGLVFILLAFGGCGYGCVSLTGFVGDIGDAIDSANTTPLNTATTLRATGDAAIILTSDSTAVCLVADPSGAEVTVDEPAAGASGTLDVNGETLDLAYTFETDAGTTYDVVCGDEAGTLTGNYAVAPIPGLGKLGGIAAGAAAGIVLLPHRPAAGHHRSGQALEVEEEPGSRRHTSARWVHGAAAARWGGAAAARRRRCRRRPVPHAARPPPQRPRRPLPRAVGPTRTACAAATCRRPATVGPTGQPAARRPARRPREPRHLRRRVRSEPRALRDRRPPRREPVLAGQSPVSRRPSAGRQLTCRTTCCSSPLT